MKKLYLIDISSLFFRSYYAISPNMTNKEGQPTNALYGVLKMIHKLMREKKPDYMISCFDSKKPSFRKKIFPDYKANRGEMPEDLALQAPYLKEMMKFLCISLMERPGFEADDLVASLAKHWLERYSPKAGLEVYIVSGDKDFAQLVGDQVFLYDTMKEKIYDSKAVKEKWGVWPKQMLDYLSLTGDSSDNIPGAKGIGPKSAAALLEQCESLQGIYGGLSGLKGALQKKLEAGKEEVFLSKKLISLKDDLEWNRPFSEAAVRSPDHFAPEEKQKLKEFLEGLNFKSFLNMFFPEALESRPLPASCPSAESRTDGSPPPPLPPAAPQKKSGEETARQKTKRKKNSREASSPGLSRNSFSESPLQAEQSRAPGLSSPPKRLRLARGEDFFQNLEPCATIWIEALEDHICLAHKKSIAVLEPAEWREAGRRLDEKWIRCAGYDLKSAWQKLSIRRPIAEWDAALAGHLLDSRPQDSFESLCRLHLKGTDQSETAERAESQTAKIQIRKNSGAKAKAAKTKGQPAGESQWNENKSLFEIFPEENNPQTDSQAPLSKTKSMAENQTENRTKPPTESPAERHSKNAEAWLARRQKLQDLKKILESKLKKMDLEKVFKTIELPLTGVLYSMERRGMPLNEEEIKKQSESLKTDIEALERRIHAAAGEEFNISSPKQLAAVLFDKLKIPRGRKTKLGYSTDSHELTKKKNLHLIIPLVLEHRELFKLKTTYTDSLLSLIDPKTKRIHSQFRQAATSTGRLSSVSPNLQNIPIRGERGRQIRKAFTAPPGSQLISADYSQLELRILAHITEDPGLMKAFAENLDIHAATASEIFHVPIDQVSPELRRKSKAVNFGIAYGQGAHGLSEALNISRGEAKEIIDSYFNKFKKIKDYIEAAKEEAQSKFYVKTVFGRKRFFDKRDFGHPKRKAAAERAAINAPIQGTASDLMKIAMIQLDESLPIPILSQVHDELLFECPKESAEEESREIISIMENCVSLKVPLKVNLMAGANWAEAHS